MVGSDLANQGYIKSRLESRNIQITNNAAYTIHEGDPRETAGKTRSFNLRPLAATWGDGHAYILVSRFGSVDQGLPLFEKAIGVIAPDHHRITDLVSQDPSRLYDSIDDITAPSREANTQITNRKIEFATNLPVGELDDIGRLHAENDWKVTSSGLFSYRDVSHQGEVGTRYVVGAIDNDSMSEVYFLVLSTEGQNSVRESGAIKVALSDRDQSLLETQAAIEGIYGTNPEELVTGEVELHGYYNRIPFEAAKVDYDKTQARTFRGIAPTLRAA